MTQTYHLTSTIQLIEVPFPDSPTAAVNFRASLSPDSHGKFEAADATQDDLNNNDPDKHLRWHHDVNGECAGIIRRRAATETFFLVLRALPAGPGTASPAGSDGGPVRVLVTFTPHTRLPDTTGSLDPPTLAVTDWRHRITPYARVALVIVVVTAVAGLGWWHWRRRSQFGLPLPLPLPVLTPPAVERSLTFGEALNVVKANVQNMNTTADARAAWHKFGASVDALGKNT